MTRKVFYIIITLFLISSCATTSSQTREAGKNSFRDVPPELEGVNWIKSPNDVISNPIKDEPLIWVGLIKDVTVSNKGNEIEIEWLCEHLAFTEPGPAAITVRPIKVHKGSGHFALSIVSNEMPMERALKFKQQHTSSPHYVVAGGTFYSIIERNNRKVPFLYTLLFGMGPDVAKIIE
ncbi:MAG: hypothetical protein JXA41_03270 [Deltaproteobacteria bacterium]|nr:hypothetical protein [Deltaproteobacteria bacterium]